MTAWLARLVSPHLREAIRRARAAERARSLAVPAADAQALERRAIQAEAALDEYQRAHAELTRQYRQERKAVASAETALAVANDVIADLRTESSWHPLAPPVEDDDWRRRARAAERACHELTERLATCEGRPLQRQLPPVRIGPDRD